MSRGLTSDQIAFLQRESTKIKVLIQVTDNNSVTTRYCSGSTPYYYKSNIFTPHAIRVSASSTGKIDVARATIEVCNRDDAFSKIISVKGLCGGTCKVFLAPIDLTLDAATSIITLVDGVISRCSIGDDVKFEVSALNRGIKPSGLLRGSRMCGYVFKGPLCQYSGADTSCNRTLTDCNGTDTGSTKSNELHFGGFIWALDAGESILVEGAPVQVQPASASGDSECHSGRFITLRYADGSERRVELSCDTLPRNQDHDDDSGNYTEPWWFQFMHDPEEVINEEF